MPKEKRHDAPGHPGLPARWFASVKCGVGTARNVASQVWFTLSRGIVSEVFYPEVDSAAIRDMGLIVTDVNDPDFFSEEQTQTDQEVVWLEEGVPAFRLTNTCRQGRYRIVKTIITDPRLPVLLQHTEFIPLRGALDDYRLFVLLAPHLHDQGSGNTAWVDDYKGLPALFAKCDGVALALLCDPPWIARSAGYVGVSDGWQDLNQHKQLTWCYRRAEDGNVALTGAVELTERQGSFLLALGFGNDPLDAAHHARASLYDGFDAACREYVQGWRDWQRNVRPQERNPGQQHDLYRISAAVLSCHEAKAFPGGIIASLSEPWGQIRGDQDRGGYHMVWPRDLSEIAGGLLAIDKRREARQVLYYLQATQEADGHWPQNMWLNGKKYLKSEQMDEIALPILLVDLARRQSALGEREVARLWPMVRNAAGYVVRNGPFSTQDRWEVNEGYAVFTVATEIAALLAAAELADLNGETTIAKYLRETADVWNDSIETRLYASDTTLAHQVGVEGYYVRITPQVKPGESPLAATVTLKNRPEGENTIIAAEHVSVDALALVRFGLRAPDHPYILATLKVLDAILKVDTPYGPVWRRYNEDGYGEQTDGSPYHKTGIGRGWPLLTGERAHYELAAGNPQRAEQLLTTMAAFAGNSGLLPEQVWDSVDIPQRDLYCGHPSGSAMPLAWAHAEYLKLRRSLTEGSVFDMPPQTVQRYVRDHTVPAHVVWRCDAPIETWPAGKTLRIETRESARVHWSGDNWSTIQEGETQATGLGTHLIELSAGDFATSQSVTFTFYWPQAQSWEGHDFTVRLSE